MSNRCPELTPAEFGVMKTLWRLDRATVAEVRAELARGGQDLAYTTVMTLLGRLATKAAVEVDRAREPYVYAPAFRRDSVLRDRLREFVRDVFDGEAGSLVLHLVEDESMSRDELRAIEQLINSAEQDGGADGSAGTKRKRRR
jgi:BlaI family penicillinase repressor